MNIEICSDNAINGIGQDILCPVCTDILLPPIKRCIFGHSFCRRCKEKIDKCPICRSDKNGGRNYTMERIVKNVTVPCRYSEKGCTIETLGATIREHQEFCKYATKRCPLRSIHGCKWVGDMQGIRGHAKQQHLGNFFSSSKVQLLCPRFQAQTQLKPDQAADNYHLLFHAHGYLFKCMWDINLEMRSTRWCIVFIGPRKEANNFYFTIKFENRENSSSKMEVIERRGICQSSHSRQSQKYNFMSIDVDELLGVTGSRGLYYAISIHKCNEWSTVFDSASNPSFSKSARICYTIPKCCVFIGQQDPYENKIANFFRKVEAEDADDEMD